MAGSKIRTDWVRNEDHGPFYDVRNPREVGILAWRILKIAEEDGEKAEVLAAVICSKGLMKTEWLTRLMVRVFKWRHGLPDVVAWQGLFNNFPQMKKPLLVETANHCQWGKDVDTPFAVCSFDQQEADYLAASLHLLEKDDDS